MSQDFYYGTGRRKTSVARTRIYNGEGQILINNRPIGDYFPRATLQMVIQQPLKLTKTDSKLDIKVNVHGGGLTGQAEAVRHGISRALLQYDPELRPALK
ncbi:MAG: 30S ribosomal protein S9, partial [Desulfovibrionales bacterium]